MWRWPIWLWLAAVLVGIVVLIVAPRVAWYVLVATDDEITDSRRYSGSSESTSISFPLVAAARPIGALTGPSEDHTSAGRLVQRSQALFSQEL